MTENIMLWKNKVDGDFQPWMTTYLLDDAKNKPAGMVLVCPGGGYRCRAEHEGEPIARKFNEMGWHAAVVQYRVAPSTFPAPQRDALRALQIIRNNADKWGVDKKQIAILGFSAGGHLAASCGTIRQDIDNSTGDAISNEVATPDAMILCYPVIFLSNGHQGSGKNLLGKEEPAAEELAPLDLQNRISAATPPAFLWHTATDPIVDVENSISFAQAMWKQQLTAELHIYPRGGHGLGLGFRDDQHPEVRSWPDLADNFLRTIGFTPAK